MATFSAKVFKHHKKSDGSYKVKICVSHQRKRKYLDANHYVSDRMLGKGLTIKDPIINAQLNIKLDDYRKAASRLERQLESFDVDQLLEQIRQSDEGIDFFKFCELHISSMKADWRGKSASNYSTFRNSLQDFFNRKSVSIQEITRRTLKDYERFLRSPRKMIRSNGHGGTTTIKSKAMSDSGVHDYFREFSGFFTAAMAYYNKPSLDLVPITYNPFEDFKIVEPPPTRKRNLKIEQIKLIQDCKVRVGSRAELARDMFMLSFYLCGMNAKDLYVVDYEICDGRLEYNRSKTETKRKDNAFISIKIPPEAIELLKKSKRLCARYKSNQLLNKALSFGMRELQKLTGIKDFTFYWARHSFGNIARNKCRKSKDDVALALNHVDQGRKTTDIYLEKDWSIIDEVQDAVMILLRRLDRPAIFSNGINVIHIFPHICQPRLY